MSGSGDDPFEEFELPDPPTGDASEFDRFDQAGIDALFGGGPVQSSRSGLRAVLESEIINHERLPMLEVVCERMVRALSTSMRNLTSDSIDISLEDVTTARFGDFMDRVTLPAMITVIRIDEWENYGIVTIDSGLIYAVVDALLGGRRSGDPDRRTRIYHDRNRARLAHAQPRHSRVQRRARTDRAGDD